MFQGRKEAGLRLSILLLEENLENAIIISIPRGGIVVGKFVADVLKVPNAALLVKKIGAPNNPELAIGATGIDGIVFWDNVLIKNLEVSEKEKKELLAIALNTIRERQKILNIGVPDVKDKTTFVIDDGVATGATSIAAALILKKLGASKIVLATPVISQNTKRELEEYFDKIIAVEIPKDFRAVGQFYREFPQIEDSEVKKILNSKN